MFQEHYDARKEPVGWKEAGFNDSDWHSPVSLGRPPVAPWTNLVAREIPHLREEELRPVAIADQGTLPGVEWASEGAKFSGPGQFRVSCTLDAGESKQ